MQSLSNDRGYLAKSSFGPNCFGLTKMEAMTGEQSRLARSISDKCPPWSAPMVGTRPTMRLSARAWRACSFIQAMVRMVSTWEKRAAKLGPGGRGAFPIEVHEVREDRLRAELPQKRRDLSAMIGAVIHEMLHRLPERVAIDAELQRLVFHHAIQVGLSQAPHKAQQARFVLIPALLKARNIVEFSRAGKRSRRAALEALQPDPLGAIDVRQRVAHGAEAGNKRLQKLLRREPGCRLQLAVIGPGVVVIKHAHFFGRHVRLLFARERVQA